MNRFPLPGHPPARSVRWWMLDVLVTGLVALSSLPYLIQEHVTPVPLVVGVQAALTVPLVARRIRPDLVFAWIFGVSAVTGLWDARLVVSFALVAALYAVAAYQPRRRALLAAGLVEGGVTVAAMRLAGGGWWQEATLGTGLVAAALSLGLYVVTRRACLKELHDRAERMERERDQQKELAAAERARISREMHDIVAHHLAVMIALSDGAAAASAGTSPQAAEAMRAVSATGRQARRLQNLPRVS